MYPPGTSPASTHPGVQTGHVVSGCLHAFPMSRRTPRLPFLPCALCLGVTKARNAMVTAWTVGRWMRKLSLPIGWSQASEKVERSTAYQRPLPALPLARVLIGQRPLSSPIDFFVITPSYHGPPLPYLFAFRRYRGLIASRPSNLLSRTLPPSTPPASQSHCRTARRQHGDHG